MIYNWGHNNTYGGEDGQYNIINNYYKYGPSTGKNVKYRIVNPSRTETLPYGKWYVDGNVVDEARDVSRNNWLGIHMGNGGTDADKRDAVADKAFPAENIFTQSATDAYESVLKYAGASFRRDTLDARIISDVKNRTGRLIDVQGGFPHGTPFEMSLMAWPALQSLEAPVDKDRDGMPDDWEVAHGLNPAVQDHNGTQLSVSELGIPGYTNLEVYLHTLSEQRIREGR